jgi:hypothetical protein
MATRIPLPNGLNVEMSQIYDDELRRLNHSFEKTMADLKKVFKPNLHGKQVFKIDRGNCWTERFLRHLADVARESDYQYTFEKQDDYDPQGPYGSVQEWYKITIVPPPDKHACSACGAPKKRARADDGDDD